LVLRFILGLLYSCIYLLACHLWATYRSPERCELELCYSSLFSM